MRPSFTLFSLLLALCGSAQTYFYVESLEVIPAFPTVDDSVFVEVSGGFSSTASIIVAHQVSIDGSLVNLNIDCDSPGIGLTVIVPHDTTFFLGVGLAPGDYTIDLGGAHLGDFVTDPAMYEFTVTGTNSIDEQWLRERIDYTIQGNAIIVENRAQAMVAVHLHDLLGRRVLESEFLPVGTHRVPLPQGHGALVISFILDDVRWEQTIVR